jgi:uncharacterized membrane protein
MRAQPRRDWDLWSIGVLSLVLIMVIYALPDSALRIVIGLPFILFFPGYSALSVLFPESKDLEIIERVALSFGLSIAISPLVGFGLNYTPFGIRLAPILFSLAALNVALSAGGLYRRERADVPYLPFDPAAVWNRYSTQFRAEKGADKLLTIILVISILSSVIALVYVVAVPRQGESFTEFYILGPGGNATGYPRNLTVGQDASVIIGIANHEHRTVRYTVELWLVNMSFVDNVTQVHAMYFFDSFNVTLEHTDVDLEGEWQPQWELPYDFNVTIEGNYKLWFLLYKDDVPALPFAPSPMMDYTGTSAQNRIIGAVENEVQSLNLNLRVTA